MNRPSPLAIVGIALIFLMGVALEGMLWFAQRLQRTARKPVPAEVRKPAREAVQSSPTPQAFVEPRRPAAKPAPAPSSTPSAPRVFPPEPALSHADVPTRQRYHDQLVALPPLTILERWQRAAAQPNPDGATLAVMQQAFTLALGRSQEDELPSPATLAAALANPTIPPSSREALAGALAESATLPGLEALLQSANAPALRETALHALASVGAERRENGEYPVDLSPPLETAFAVALSSADNGLAAATGRALAQIGSETGTRAVLGVLDAPAQSAQPFLPALRDAIAHLSNPAAIPALLDELNGAANRGIDVGDPGILLSGAALVHIGGAEAVEPLLEWLTTAPPEAQPLAAAWFANVREPKSAALLQSYVAGKTFRSPQIKATLQQSIKQ